MQILFSGINCNFLLMLSAQIFSPQLLTFPSPGEPEGSQAIWELWNI